MLVVSNTSPLTNLAAIGQFELLRQLYGKFIADAVWHELNAGNTRHPGQEEVARADWIECHTVQNQPLVQALSRDLDVGESETIALSLELGANITLLDEREGRRAAQRLGLRTIGVLGTLLDAKTQKLINMVEPLLKALRVEAGFYVSNDVYEQVLLLANEK
jgi:uncharacterized protein